MKIKKEKKGQCAGTTEFVFILRCWGVGRMWLINASGGGRWKLAEQKQHSSTTNIINSGHTSSPVQTLAC